VSGWAVFLHGSKLNLRAILLFFLLKGSGLFNSKEQNAELVVFADFHGLYKLLLSNFA